MRAEAQRVGRELRQHVTGVLRVLAYQMAFELHNTTPVDTTNARNNWIASVGSDHGRTSGSKENPSTAGFFQGLREIAAFQISHGFIWLSNNVHYIVDLNQGYSPQAPPQFVQKAIGKVIRLVEMTHGIFRAGSTSEAASVVSSAAKPWDGIYRS